jgi:hypothetical protein
METPRPLESFNEGDVIYSSYLHHQAFYLLQKKEETGFFVLRLKVNSEKEERVFLPYVIFPNGFKATLFVFSAQNFIDNEIERIEKERTERFQWSDRLYRELNKHKQNEWINNARSTPS